MASVPLQGTTAAHLPSSAHIPAAPSWRWVCGASARLLQHMMHEIKRRGMFRQMFRGDYLELRTFLKPTAHLTAANVRHAWAPEPFTFHQVPKRHRRPACPAQCGPPSACACA